LELRWDLDAGRYRVRVDGAEGRVLQPQRRVSPGASYLRLRLPAADEIDADGLGIERAWEVERSEPLRHERHRACPQSLVDCLPECGYGFRFSVEEILKEAYAVERRRVGVSFTFLAPFRDPIIRLAWVYRLEELLWVQVGSALIIEYPKVVGLNPDNRVGMTAEWKDPSGVLTQARPVKKNSDTEVEVTVTPGTTKGKGTLTLISAIGLRASKELSIT